MAHFFGRGSSTLNGSAALAYSAFISLMGILGYSAARTRLPVRTWWIYNIGAVAMSAMVFMGGPLALALHFHDGWPGNTAMGWCALTALSGVDFALCWSERRFRMAGPTRLVGAAQALLSILLIVSALVGRTRPVIRLNGRLVDVGGPSPLMIAAAGALAFSWLAWACSRFRAAETGFRESEQV